MYLAKFRGFGWPTASSTPEAPRERDIIELSREVTRGEGIALGRLLIADLADEFGDSVKVDACTFRGEQPCYLAVGSVRPFFFTGEALDVNSWLERATPEPENGPTDGTTADDWITLLTDGADVHHGALRLVARMVAKGLVDSEIRAYFEGVAGTVAKARGEKRVRELLGRELDRMILGARGKGFDQREGEEGEGAPSIWDEPADIRSMLETEPEPITWLARDRIQLGRAVLITGIGGSSKTRLLYHAAIGSIIKRLPWRWQIDTSGRAVLVLTEDTQQDVHRTLWGMCQAMRLTAEELRLVAERLTVFPLAGKSAELLNFGKDRILRRTPAYEHLVERIQGIGDVVFVGLDPALGLSAGDEMEQQHQRMLGKAADDMAVATGATVMLASHATKASASSEELGSHNSRGGGAITDATRGEFSLRTMTAKEAREAGITDMEERKRHVQLVATKGNHISPSAFVPVWLRRGDFGTLSEANLEFGAEQDSVTAGDLQCLKVLEGLAATCTPKLAEWRAACAALIPRDVEAAKKAMQRIVGRLSRAGLIERGAGRGIYLPSVLDADL